MPTRLMRKHFRSVIQKFQNWGLYLIAALLFLIIGLYNDYPILDGDTGTYIASGYTLQPPKDRPIFYGLFLRFFSHGYSIWMPVFAQAVLLSFLVVSFIRTLVGNISPYRTLALVLFLSLCTTAGWYVSQLLPDVFTSMLFLALFCFLFHKNASLAAKIVYWIIALYAVLVHNSHLLIAILFWMVSLLYVVLRKQKQYFKKIFVLFALCASGWMITSTSNYLAGYGFTLSPAAHVFLTGRLVENGMMKYYLDRNCGSKNYKLCQYKDELPNMAWTYVWDRNGPLQKIGGWDSSKKEHETIMKSMFSKPLYIVLWSYKSIVGTFRQLMTTDIDEINELAWVKFEPGTSPYENIKKYLYFELNELTTSKQYTHTLNVIYLDRIYMFVLIVSSLLVLIFWKKSPQSPFRKVYICMLVFVVLNAFITANFANVLTRLNSRVIWLLPFVNILFLCQYFENWYQRRKTANMSPDTDDAL